jgi:hypothetical protein
VFAPSPTVRLRRVSLDRPQGQGAEAGHAAATHGAPSLAADTAAIFASLHASCDAASATHSPEADGRGLGRRAKARAVKSVQLEGAHPVERLGSPDRPRGHAARMSADTMPPRISISFWSAVRFLEFLVKICKKANKTALKQLGCNVGNNNNQGVLRNQDFRRSGSQISTKMPSTSIARRTAKALTGGAGPSMPARPLRPQKKMPASLLY